MVWPHAVALVWVAHTSSCNEKLAQKGSHFCDEKLHNEKLAQKDDDAAAFGRLNVAVLTYFCSNSVTAVLETCNILQDSQIHTLMQHLLPGPYQHPTVRSFHLATSLAIYWFRIPKSQIDRIPRDCTIHRVIIQKLSYTYIMVEKCSVAVYILEGKFLDLMQCWSAKFSPYSLARL